MKFLTHFVASLALLATSAHATLTALPGSTPQTAVAGDLFAPVRIRVTDATGQPVARATLRWLSNLAFFGHARHDDTSGCLPDLGYTCTTTTDADGVGELRPFRAVYGGVDRIIVNGQRGSQDLGFVEIELTVLPRNGVGQVQPISGGGQRGVRGTTLAQPFVVRLVDANGQPRAGVDILFTPDLQPSQPGSMGYFGSDLNVTIRTDVNGFATSPPMQLRTGLGEGAVRAVAYDPQGPAQIEARFAFTSTTPAGATSLALQDMWWSGFEENGWGISIAQRDDRLFSVIYAYDDAGNPTWRVVDRFSWAGNAHYEFAVGDLLKPASAPYYAYDRSRFNVGPSQGMFTANFPNDQAATVSFGGQSKTIRRQDFTGDIAAPITGVGGMWYGGEAQAGWGLALMEQFGGLFSVWLTYGDDGQPTWFVMPDGRWTDSRTYEGTIYRTRSSRFFGAAYDASRLQVTAVGTFRYRFQTLDTGVFEYTAEGHAGSMPIVRQEF